MSLDDVPVFGTRIEGYPYVRRPSAYALVWNEGGELAVVRTAQGCFLPGGGVENDESPEQAVERESREECGLVLRASSWLGRAIEMIYSASENTFFEKNSVFIEADMVALMPSGKADHELIWMKGGQALDALSCESHRWAVRRLIGQVPYR